MAVRGRTILAVVLFLFLGIFPAESQTWVMKVSALTNTVLGNPLTANPLNPDIIYGSPGNNLIYISRNRGVTWSIHGNPTPIFGTEANVIKSIAINPLDTTDILVGLECSSSAADRVLKSTNGGLTWHETWTGTFSFYGQPLEFEPGHPDTVYTMGNDTLYRSLNFGSTWDTMMVARGPLHFNMWCDAEIRPDSANVMLIGDAASGIWKTYDYGASWKIVYATVGSGEIPSIAINPFDPKIAYATRFSGGGGLLKSTDWGETWNPIPTPAGATPTWWVTCSPVHPDYVYFGMYTMAPGGVFISRDAGGSWENFADGLSATGKFNYGLYAYDSLTVIALQANGIHRLEYPKSIQVIAPNGGESYAGTMQHTISWAQSNLYMVRLQFSTNNGATWTTLKDSIPPSQTTFQWTVPAIASSLCRIRVVDALYTPTADTSDATFSISPFVLLSPNGGEVWGSGSVRAITWVATDFPAVAISYSSDSGVTWNAIANRPSSAGSYGWLVPEISSTGMKIKLNGTGGSSPIAVQSAGVFSVFRFSQYAAAIRIEDNGGAADTLRLGAIGGATDSIDAGLGETELAPAPGSGVFDVRWKIPGANGTRLDLRDTVSDAHLRNTLIAELQPGGGGFPLTLTWDPDSMTAGVYILRDAPTHGTKISVDMRATGSAVVTGAEMLPIEIIQAKPFTVTFGPGSGWNLLSLPVEVGDRRRTTLFPYSTSAAFTYDGSYRQSDTIPGGMGFWIKLLQPAYINGAAKLSDTIPLRNGWNLIGSVACAGPDVTPGGGAIITSPFYGYPAGSYQTTMTLLPGNGYWVKSSGSGSLFLDCPGSAMPGNTVASSPGERFNVLRIRGESGGEVELLFGPGKNGVESSFYELPPAPPGATGDARFARDSRLQLHPETFENVLEYPIYAIFEGERIYFSWDVENEENFTYILKERSGVKEIAEVRLSGQGNLLFKQGDQSTFTLSVQHSTGRAEQPIDFSLGEIYPNPFNPTARITFSTPSAASVNISVYSTLGELIATLTDGVVEEGEHLVEWHGVRSGGIPVSSGMYFIVMRAAVRSAGGSEVRREYSGVRKVLLLK